LKYSIRLSMLLVIIALIFIVFYNAIGVKNAGSHDNGNPFAEIWYTHSRIEYGWPVKYIRNFDKPSKYNESGHIDYIALSINIVVWSFILAACASPIIIVLLRRVIIFKSFNITRAAAQPLVHTEDSRPRRPSNEK
jgi:hypothetical protein